jgi:hypothetical protein
LYFHIKLYISSTELRTADPNLEFPSRTPIQELSLHIPAVCARLINAALLFLKFPALPGKQRIIANKWEGQMNARFF